MFSASTNHALRAVALLASRPRSTAVLGRDLARELRVPAHYLANVLATLARAGVVDATRGVRGGYRLARDPGQIRLADVVLPFEGRRARPGCLMRPGQSCRDSRACAAHPAWSRVKGAYLDFLDATTVADISETT